MADTDLVFISANSADFAYAEQVYSFLETRGVRTFLSSRSLPELGNSDYRKVIDEQLDRCRHMVVVTSSRERVESPWVEAEWGFFVNSKRSLTKVGNLVTVTVGNLTPGELPPSLRYYEVVRLEAGALDRLLKYLRPPGAAVHVLLGAPSTSGAHGSMAAPGSAPAEPGVKGAPGRPADMVEPRTEMEFIHVAPGSFEMGDLFGDGEPNEVPVRVVEIAGFLIGKFPVTQRQWEAVMGFNPSRSQGPDLPVTNVSWFDAQEFISALSNRGSTPFRLPAEAEWEYAARSGGKKEKWAGTSKPTEVAAVAWTYANSGARTHPVGSRRSNDLGLFDMSGNVWEWCSDRYQEAPSVAGAEAEPTEVLLGEHRVYRGGSCINPPGDARTSYRGNGPPTGRASNVGFRLVRALE